MASASSEASMTETASKFTGFGIFLFGILWLINLNTNKYYNNCLKNAFP